MLRTSLPDSITLPNGKVLDKRMHYLPGLTCSKATIIERAKRIGASYRFVEVIGRNLRGRLDLYGLPYTPSTWVLSDKDLRPPQKVDASKA